MMKTVIEKFRYAFQGLTYGIRKDRSIRIQFLFALAAIAVSCLFGFTALELCVVLTYCALVIALEYVNSAIEGMMDLVEPEYSDRVRHIKDMAAAGVLVISLAALITGLSFVIRHLG